MNSLNQNLLRQLDSLSSMIDRAERTPVALTAADPLATQVAAAFSNLERSLVDYNEFAKREINTVKRDKAALRAKKFSEEIQFMLDRWQRAQMRAAQQSVYADQRTDLFHRSGAPGGPTGSGGGAVALEMGAPSAAEYYTHEQARLHGVESHLDDFLAMGQSVLGNLSDQRATLKRTHRRMLDAANTIGVSRQLMSYIERRGTQDKWLFLSGVVISCALIWAMVHYLR